MTRVASVAAVDLGASSGRVMAGRGGLGILDLHEVHRFANVPVTTDGALRWDIHRLYAETMKGLGMAARGFELASVGIDTWGVDYGLLDAAGALLASPVHYRDPRTDGVAARVLASVGEAELYAVTGTQTLPFNTLYQLVAATQRGELSSAATLLMIPDLLGYWMTGERGAEVTIASTTQLYDVRARDWAYPVMARTGIPQALFPALRKPGEPIGGLLPGTARKAGLEAGTAVTAVGSHDTASAVAAVPADRPGFAYISCGTWSLAGMELDSPVLTAASRLANFTNETGIDGTIRYLRNVMGLWLLQESLRAWRDATDAVRLDSVLGDAARLPPLRVVINPDDPVFLPPGDIPGRIRSACRSSGQPVPEEPAEIVRCILDSLALAHRRAIRQVQELSGMHADTVHIVGGGARNALLCQLTADACALPVVAGPAEATAIGNVLVQLRSLGAAPDDMAGLRALVRATQPLRTFRPAGGSARWAKAELRLKELFGC